MYFFHIFITNIILKMRVILTEEQIRKYILENEEFEGWELDADTNRLKWVKDNDKYVQRANYRWERITDKVPQYWGKKQPIKTVSSLNNVENPVDGEIVFIYGKGRNSGHYYRWTNKVEGETDVQGADTRILKTDDNGNKTWNVKVIPLTKTKINSYHFIGLPSFDLTKSMKHGYIERGSKNQEKQKVSFDRESIAKFAEYMRTYVWHFLKSYNGTGFLPIDIIASPETSGELNKILINQLKKILPNAKVMTNLFDKDLENMSLNQDILRQKGEEYMRSLIKTDSITPEQEKLMLARLEVAIIETNNDFKKAQARGLAKNIMKQIKITNDNIKKLGKGNHKKAKEIANQQIAEYEKKIEEIIIPFYKSKNYSRFWKDDKLKDYDEVKGFQIKNLHQVARAALDNFFKLSSQNDKNISYTDKQGNTINKTISTQEQLQNKRILVVDDNYSTGATLDNICQLLLNIGVKRNDIIPISLGVVSRSYAGGGIDKFSVKGGIV